MSVARRMAKDAMIWMGADWRMKWEVFVVGQ